MIDDDMRWLPVLVSSVVMLVPAGIGVTLIFAGARQWLRARRLTADGMHATAVVVDNQQQSLSEGRIRFLPVVRFHTRSGQEVRTVLEDQGGNRSHLAGTEFPIVYDPDNPQRAGVPDARIGRLVGSVVVGLVFLGIALFAYRMFGGPFEHNEPFHMP